MVKGIEVPLGAAMAAWLGALALGTLVERIRQRRRKVAGANPLAGLFAPSALAGAIDSANRHAAGQPAAQAVLRGRIDQTAVLRTGWDATTREQVLGHVAGVMRAGIRRDDNFMQVEGDSFAIIMSGADERAAKGVADRLRRALTQMKLPQFGGDNPFTASFGVAAGGTANSSAALVARALAALDAAQKSGADHVVAASEIEEIIFLPAPDRSAPDPSPTSCSSEAA
ncbi:MAG: diguanylate cyclase [Erythrobacteraceae bacterium]|nr:diguanylate cyclase [Erythrobacteraceae bacterium]